MQVRLGRTILASVLCSLACAGATPDRTSQTVALTVPAGVPLRLYLTKRIPKKAGTPVQAKLLDPLFAFDHQVVPAGAIVTGVVRRIEPVARNQRVRAILAGDLTPLHTAFIEFSTVELPDGKKLELHTIESTGLGSLVSAVALKTPPPQQTKRGVLGTGKQKASDAIHAELQRAKSVVGLAKAPDKKERLYDFAMSKLPYHPQFYRKGERFDAELRDSLSFGTEALQPGALAKLGSEPAGDSAAHARLITPVDSASSKIGQPVEAVLSAPLFSADHQLVMPEGTRLLGSVVVARPARFFHRGGKLRFTFSKFEIPEAPILRTGVAPAAAAVPAARPPQLELRTRATLQSVESDGKSPVKVDEEGGVQAKESKKRFIAPAISAFIARAAGDNDPERAKGGAIIGQNPNVGGRTLGGASGFGLLGAAAAQSSRYVGAAFGFYGMAWSVYSNVISRGFEVAFPENTMFDIKFNTRTTPEPVHGQ
jgi:hypothetical protein